MLRIGLVLVLLFGSASCSQEAGLSEKCAKMLKELAPTGEAAKSSQKVEGGDQRLECGLHDVSISGSFDSRAKNLEWPAYVNTFYGGKIPTQATFLSVAMMTHVEIPTGEKYRIGFNVAPGTYKGDGTYELTAERPTIDGQQGLAADVFVEILLPAGSEVPIVRYEKITGPCRAKVSDAGSKGELSCTGLASESGTKVNLNWTWDMMRGPESTPD